MKRFMVGLMVMILGMLALGRAEVVELSKKYLLSNIQVGYMDHFHHEGKGRDFNLSFAGLAFSQQIQMDPFFTFESGLKEVGFAFPVKVNRRFYLLPAFFHNFDAEEYGMAINATVILR